MGKRVTEPTRIEWRLQVGRRLKLLIAAFKDDTDWLKETFAIGGSKWSQWKNGEYPPDVELMTHLCFRTGVTLDWLYRDQDEYLSPDAKKQLADAKAREAEHRTARNVRRKAKPPPGLKAQGELEESNGAPVRA